jgi:serine/threonine protein kinase
MIGFPTQEDIDRCPNAKAREKLRQLPRRQGAKFNIEFADCNPDAVDLVRQMLIFDPTRRITVAQAL